MSLQAVIMGLDVGYEVLLKWYWNGTGF